MRKISNLDQKIECSKICFAEASKCAKRIEKAMAKCGVQLSGFYDDPAGTILYAILENHDLEEDGKISSYKPSKAKIIDLAGDFQKTYARKKK